MIALNLIRVVKFSQDCQAHKTYRFTRQRQILLRADFRLAPSQWETSLQSNAVSHWLGANLKSALLLISGLTNGPTLVISSTALSVIHVLFCSLVSMMSPEDSWVGKWQRVSKWFTRGVPNVEKIERPFCVIPQHWNSWNLPRRNTYW